MDPMDMDASRVDDDLLDEEKLDQRIVESIKKRKSKKGRKVPKRNVHETINEEIPSAVIDALRQAQGKAGVKMSDKNPVKQPREEAGSDFMLNLLGLPGIDPVDVPFESDAMRRSGKISPKMKEFMETQDELEQRLKDEAPSKKPRTSIDDILSNIQQVLTSGSGGSSNIELAAKKGVTDEQRKSLLSTPIDASADAFAFDLINSVLNEAEGIKGQQPQASRLKAFAPAASPEQLSLLRAKASNPSLKAILAAQGLTAKLQKIKSDAALNEAKITKMGTDAANAELVESGLAYLHDVMGSTATKSQKAQAIREESVRMRKPLAWVEKQLGVGKRQ